MDQTDGLNNNTKKQQKKNNNTNQAIYYIHNINAHPSHLLIY